jgi:hypothetical protein
MESYSKSSDITQTRALLLERLLPKYPYSVHDTVNNDIHFRTDVDGQQVELIISLYSTLGVVQADGYDELTDRVGKEIQKEVDDIYLHYV